MEKLHINGSFWYRYRNESGVFRSYFEPFAQEHTDARSVYHGTGLGMSIVKALIDRMDGTIEVQSKEGEGSTFTLTIPFEIASAEDMAQTQTVTEEAGIAGLHLLLAEDNVMLYK